MTLEPDDRGLLLGDGLFETLLWSGALVDFAAHAKRLRRGCEALGLPAPAASDLEAAATSAIAVAGLTDQRAAVRLTWTAGGGGRGLDRPEPVQPRLFASAAPAPSASGPARLVTVDIARNDRSPASRLKTLAYLDNVLARRAGSGGRHRTLPHQQPDRRPARQPPRRPRRPVASCARQAEVTP
jgi:branched-subunit amino acid aminotransferase/4-amino-4-deoxychorismate lyase